MPRKNLVKDYRPDTGYHVYNRGYERSKVFRDDVDHADFMRRLRDLLLGQARGRGNQPIAPDVRLIAFALMPNHFHLYLEQGEDADAIARFMRALTPAYSRRFAERHGLSGVRPVWDGAYRARPVYGAAARIDLISYIHLNRDGRERSRFTSHPNYVGTRTDAWLDHERGLRPFGGSRGYVDFLGNKERIRGARRYAADLEW